jgi:hypothetical protein
MLYIFVSNYFVRHPADMTNLCDGRFAVRDEIGIEVFDEAGNHLKSIGLHRLGQPFGLAFDGLVSSVLFFSWFVLKKRVLKTSHENVTLTAF